MKFQLRGCSRLNWTWNDGSWEIQTFRPELGAVLSGVWILRHSECLWRPSASGWPLDFLTLAYRLGASKERRADEWQTPSFSLATASESGGRWLQWGKGRVHLTPWASWGFTSKPRFSLPVSHFQLASLILVYISQVPASGCLHCSCKVIWLLPIPTSLCFYILVELKGLNVSENF